VEDDAALQTIPDILAVACGGRSAMVLYEEGGGGSAIPLMNYWPLDACTRYFNEFTEADPWVAAYRRHYPTDGRAVAADELLPPETFARTTIYNELIRPLGDDTARCLGTVLAGGPVRFQIGVHRAGRERAFDKAETAMLEVARDHLGRVFRLRRLLAAERGERRQIEAMLDATDRAMMLVDNRLTIARATPAAVAILSARDGLEYQNGRLTLGRAAIAAELKRLVRACIADRPSRRSTLLCPRPAALAYRIRVLPPARTTPGYALLVVDDPSSDRGEGIRAFSDAYGLSPAETALAVQLEAGSTIDEVASARRVTRETIRTQLRSLFVRTETNRQSDLVRLLTTLPGRAQS
jgi:DNA-binding CsgD family transcriptional regulator